MNIRQFALGLFGVLFFSTLALGKEKDCSHILAEMAIRLRAAKIKFEIENDRIEILPSSQSKIGEVVASFSNLAKTLKVARPKIYYDPNLNEKMGVTHGYHWISNSLYLTSRDLLSHDPLREYSLAESLVEFNYFSNERIQIDSNPLYAAQIIIPHSVAPVPFSYLTVLVAKKIIEIAEINGDQKKVRETAIQFLALFKFAQNERQKMALSINNEIFYHSILAQVPFFEERAK